MLSCASDAILLNAVEDLERIVEIEGQKTLLYGCDILALFHIFMFARKMFRKDVSHETTFSAP